MGAEPRRGFEGWQSIGWGKEVVPRVFPAGQNEGSRGSGGEGRARLTARMRERRGGAEALPCGRRPATVPNMACVASRCGVAQAAGWNASVRRKA